MAFKTAVSTPNVGDDLDLFITTVESRTNDRFIHFWAQYDTNMSNELEVLMQQFESDYLAGNISQSSFRPVSKGKYCLAKFQEDNKWYRALVTDVHANDATVFFIDYGNTENVSHENIVGELSEYFVLPPIAVPCVLADIVPNNYATCWTENELKLVSDKLSYGEFSATVLGKTGSKGGPPVYTFRLYDGVGSRTPLVGVLIDEGLGQKYSNAHLNMISIPKTLLEPRKEYPVYISYCESLEKFWIQKVSSEDELNELMGEIDSHYASSASPAVQDIDLGSVCVSRFSENGMYYRCVVTNINDNCTVQFIDYGNSEAKSRDEVRVLDEKFCAMPAQAIECSLHGAELIKELPGFDALVDSDSLKCTVISISSTGQHTVTLCDTSTGKVYPGSATQSAINKNSPPLDIGNGIICRIKPEQLSVGECEDLCISHIDHLGQFHCQRLATAHLLTSLMAEIQHSYTSTSASPVQIESGMGCIVRCKHDGYWYRGEVLSCLQKEAHVRYVDFGNVEALPVEEIKQLKIEHMALPAQATQCMMSGFGKDPNTFIPYGIDFLTRYESQQPLVAKVLQSTGTTYEVELYDTHDKDDLLINEEIRKLHVMCSPAHKESDSVVPSPAIEISTVKQLYVTAVHSATQFFGQLIYEDGENVRLRVEEMEKLVNTLIRMKGSPFSHTRLPAVGEHVSVSSSCDSGPHQYHRVKVLSVADRQTELFYQDYGYIRVDPVDELQGYGITGAFKREEELKQQGIVCILSDISASATKTLLEEVLLERKVFVVIEGHVGEGVFDVSFVAHPANKPVLTALSKYLTAAPPASQPSEKRTTTVDRSQNSKAEPPISMVSNSRDNAVRSASPPRSCVNQGHEKNNPGFSGDLDLEYLSPAIEIGMYEDVGVTDITDPEHFYCHLASSEEELFTLMKIMNDFCNGLAPGKGKLAQYGLGIPCLSKFSADNNWYRAQITGVLSSGKLEVQFVDFGNCEIVTKDQVCATKPEFMMLPRQAVHCALNGLMCHNDSWTDAQIVSFKSRVLDKPFRVLFQSFDEVEEKHVIELFDGNTVISEKFGQVTKTLSSRYTRPDPPPRKLNLKVPPGSAKAVENQLKQNLHASSEKSSQHTSALPNGSASSVNTGWASGFEKSRLSSASSDSDSVFRSASPSSVGDGKQRQNVTRSGSKFKPTDVSAGELIDVCVVYVNNPEDFYCQLVKHCNELDDLMNNLDRDYGKLGPSELSLPSPEAGVSCVAKFSEDEAWYRAEVVSVQGKMGKVRYVDYGNTEMVALSSLKQLLPAYSTLPAQAIKCSLYNVKPVQSTWQEGGVNKFNALTVDKSLVGQVKGKNRDGSVVIDLNDADSEGGAIWKELVKSGHARFAGEDASGASGGGDSRRSSLGMGASSTSGAAATHVEPTDFPLVNIANGQTSSVVISHINSPDEFWVQLTEAGSDLDMLMNDIETVYVSLKLSDMPVTDAREGKACIAPFSEDGNWYRASIKSIQSRQVEVMFIDYGNSEVVTLSKVKEIKPEFTELPAQAVPCTLKGVIPAVGRKWPDDVVQMFKKKTDDKALQCTFLACCNGVYLVDLTDVAGNSFAQDLVSSGHARLRSVTGSVGSSSSRSSQSSSRTASVKSFKSTQSQQSQSSFKSAQSQVSAKSQGSIRSAQSLSEKVKVKSDSAEEEMKVNTYQNFEVCHVVSPQQFWCQMVKQKAKLDTMMDSIEAAYRVLSENDLALRSLSESQVCMAKFSEDDIFYRAEVKHVLGPAEAEVYFVDYGNSERTTLDRIKLPMPDYSYKALPPQAIECGLADVPNDCSAAAKARFEELTTEKQLVGLICSKVNQKLELELLDTSGAAEVNINKEVVEANRNRDAGPSPSRSTVATASPVNVSKAQAKLYPLPPISAGMVESAYVSHVDSPSKFYLQLARVETEMNTYTAHVNDVYSAYADGEKAVGNLVKGMPCCALYEEDSSWYRAVVTQVTDRGAMVTFVDFGNSADVATNQIKELTPEFIENPPFALESKLSNITAPSAGFSQEISVKFEELLVDKELKVNFRTDEPPFEVNLKVDNTDVSDLLKGLFPALAPAPEVKEETLYETFKILQKGVETAVFVSHVESPDEFYIQLAGDEAVLLEIMGKVEEGCASPSKEKSLGNPKVGQRCAALYTVDGAWYRAVVKEISGSQVTVNFIDYGNSEKVDASSLQMLSQELRSCAPMSLQCGLGNTSRPVDGWSSETADALLELVQDKEIQMVVMSPGVPCQVQLLLDGADVAEKLSISKNQEETQQPASLPIEEPGFSLKPMSVPTGVTSVYVSHIESPDLLFLQLAEKEAELNKMMDDIESKYSSIGDSDLQVSQPQIGKAYCTRYSQDNAWYRAEVESVQGSSVQVKFVDYGNAETVQQSGIKSLSADLAEVPMQAVPCQVIGLSRPPSGWPDGLCDTLNEITQEKLLTAEFDAQLKPVGVKLYEGDEEIAELARVKHGLQPSLQEVAEESTAIQLPPAAIPTNDEQCFISHIESPCMFFVHLTREESVLQELMDKLAVCHESDAGDLLKSVKVGQVCCAKFSEDDSWYRASVTAVCGEEVTVCFVDYGNSEVTRIGNLRAMREEFATLPPLAVPCKLSEYEDSSEAATDQFSALTVDKELSASFVSKSSPCPVILSLDGKNLITEQPGTGKETQLTTKQTEEEDTVATKQVQEEETVSAIVVQKEALVHSQPDGHKSYVSHVDSLTKFYIQMADREDALNILMEKIASECTPENEDSILVTPGVGDICCALYSEDDSWYRARINSIGDEGVSVIFIDYGNTDLVAATHLKVLSDELATEPAFAIECTLVGAASSEEQQDVCDRFTELTADKITIVDFLTEVEPRLVSLKDEKGDMNEQLGLPTDVVVSENSEKKVDSEVVSAPCEAVVAPCEAAAAPSGGEMVYVSHVDSADEVYIQLVSNEERLTEVMDAVADLCSAEDSELLVKEPVVGNVYCAQYSEDESWYRAQIVAIEGDDVAVFFIDYGNSDHVDISKLKKLREDLTSVPPIAERCRLRGEFNIEDSKLSEDIIELTSDKELTAKIDRGVSPCLVTLFDEEGEINERLKSYGAESQPEAEVEDSRELVNDQIEAANITQSASERTEVSLAETLDLTSFRRRQLRVAEKEEIYVAHIVSPSQFWCQFVHTELQLSNLMAELADYCREHEGILEAPEKGVICAAKFEADQGWYRAKVLSVDDGHALVRFVDYGNTDSVPFADLLSIPAEFLGLEEQAFECVLFGVKAESGTWSSESQARFEELVLDKKLLAEILLIGEDSDDLAETTYVVKLLDMGISVAQRLLDEDLAVDSKLPSHLRRVQQPTTDTSSTELASQELNDEKVTRLKFVDVKAGDKLDVYVVSVVSPSEFWCQVAGVHTELPLLMDKIQAWYTQTDSPVENLSNPAVGVSCVALYSGDNNWYRAKVIEVTEEEVTVLFVDYGNCESVNRDVVKEILEEFTVLPMQAFCCSLAGVKCQGEEWDEVTINRFNEITCDKDLIVRVVAVEMAAGQLDSVSVQLYDGESSIGQQLVDSGYAQLEELAESREAEEGSTDGELDMDAVAAMIVNQTIQHVKDDLMTQNEVPVVHQYAYPELQVDDLVEVYDVSAHDDRTLLCYLTEFREQFDQLGSSITQHCSQSLEPLTEAQVGQTCLAMFSEDETWYRAVVTDASDEDCKVQFIDYGNSESVPHSLLRPMTSAFIELPVQAVFITLAGVQTPLKQEAKDYLSEVCSEKTMKIRIRERNDFNEYDAHLLDPSDSSGKYLNYTLATRGLCTLVEGLEDQNEERTDEEPIFQQEKDLLQDSHDENEEQETSFHEVRMQRSSSLGSFAEDYESYESIKTPSFVSAYKAARYTDGDELELYLLSASDPDNLVGQSVVSMEDLSKLAEKLKHKYEMGYEFLMLPSPHIGQPCCARFSEDGSWRRAQITSIPNDNQLQVYYVDYGNTEIMKKDRVKPLVDMFGKLPPQAVHCCVANARPVTQTWSKEAGSALMELAVDTTGQQVTITAKVTAVEDEDRLVVNLRTSAGVDFRQFLVDKNFAASLNDSSSQDVGDEYSFTQDEVEEDDKNKLDDDRDERNVPPYDQDDDTNVESSNDTQTEASDEQDDIVIKKEIEDQSDTSDHSAQQAEEEEPEISSQLGEVESSAYDELPSIPTFVKGEECAEDEETDVTDSSVTTDGQFATQLKPYGVNVGDTHKVMMSYSMDPSLFWCRVITEDWLKPFMNEMQDYYSIDALPAPSSVEEGQAVCVQYSEDNQWYRAQVQSVYHDVVTVLFVDVGNTETTSLTTSVRPLSKQFNVHPPAALRCFISDIDPVQGDWNPESGMYMSQVCDNTFTMEITEVHDDVVFGVKLTDEQGKNLADELILKGLARVRTGREDTTTKEETDEDSSLAEKRLADQIYSITTDTGDETKMDASSDAASTSVISVETDTISSETVDTSCEAEPSLQPPSDDSNITADTSTDEKTDASIDEKAEASVDEKDDSSINQKAQSSDSEKMDEVSSDEKNESNVVEDVLELASEMIPE